MQNERAVIDAILNGSDQLAELIAECEDWQTHTIVDPRPTNHSIGHGMTWLQLASYRPRHEGVAAATLLDLGAKVDLYSACGLGKLDRVQEILDTTPDAVSLQVGGYFPIQFAITAGENDVVRMLQTYGDDSNRNLRKVAYFGWEDETTCQEFTPWKPIHMSALYGFNESRIPVAEALADTGADLNAVSPLDGFRPIHLLAMANRIAMIEFLVSRGIDVDSRTAACQTFMLSEGNDGPPVGRECTPLMIAAAEGFAEATKLLLDLGANSAIENNEGKTARDLASRRFWNGQPYDEVLELLGA